MFWSSSTGQGERNKTRKLGGTRIPKVVNLTDLSSDERLMESVRKTLSRGGQGRWGTANFLCTLHTKFKESFQIQSLTQNANSKKGAQGGEIGFLYHQPSHPTSNFQTNHTVWIS